MGTVEIQTVTMKDREENPGKPGIPMPDNPLYPTAQMTSLIGAILNTFTPCRFA